MSVIPVTGHRPSATAGASGTWLSRMRRGIEEGSIIYALLDCSAIIKARHLQAALAVWRYREDSARFIFGDSLGDPTADEILRALRMRVDGMTRTELRDLFQRNRSGEEIGWALGVLQENGLASVERCRESADQIKPTERWFAITASSRHSQVVNVV